MNRFKTILITTAWLAVIGSTEPAAAQPSRSTVDGSSGPVAGQPAESRPLADYFQVETERIASRPLIGVESAEEWARRRPGLQRELLEMLGLDPLPERTDLKAQVRNVVERPDFVVENIVFESMPGLYVTGNLYRPKVIAEALPAILYVCGHARVESDGVIYGSKAHYQHHAAWYAANGFVCLIVDTLQLGEAPGLHHGTYREDKFWWQSRGYTPAGVEVWNGMRAVDYLVSRSDVDPRRLGVTGRSGGGAISWYLGAVDDRFAAVVPVAGITDLSDHVVAGNPEIAYPDGVIEGHCDCMYTINTYLWDYDTVAALVAPKALLVENTTSDPIFPEAGVRRIHAQLERLYGWYDAAERLDLLIGGGGHVDSPELRHRSYSWFARWLQNDALPVDDVREPDRRVPIELLKVLDPSRPLPPNQNDTIEESFVAKAIPPTPPSTPEEWDSLRSDLLTALRSKVFGTWPVEGQDAQLLVDYPYMTLRSNGRPEVSKSGLSVTAIEFWTAVHPESRRRLWRFHAPTRAEENQAEELIVLSAEGWDRYSGLVDAFESEGENPIEHPMMETIRERVDTGVAISLFAPLGIGPTAWPVEKDTHIRRRFALLGRTLDSERVLDVRRAIRCLSMVSGGKVWISGRSQAAAVALWASVFEPNVEKITLVDLPTAVRDGPAFLNLERVLTMPQAVALLHPRRTILVSSQIEPWSWALKVGENLGSAEPWPTLVPDESTP